MFTKVLGIQVYFVNEKKNPKNFLILSVKLFLNVMLIIMCVCVKQLTSLQQTKVT